MQRASSVSFAEIVIEAMRGSRFAAEEEFIQHGNTSCLLHSIAVAYFCYRIAKKLGFLDFRLNELVRGALLHDYFLYDWHDGDKSHRLHGFFHAARARKNAERDFALSPISKDIIEKHMFPLNLALPRYRESVIVTVADKICAVREMVRR